MTAFYQAVEDAVAALTDQSVDLDCDRWTTAMRCTSLRTALWVANDFSVALEYLRGRDPALGKAATPEELMAAAPLTTIAFDLPDGVDPDVLGIPLHAEQQGLNLQRFYHWHRRLKRLGLDATDTPVSFAAVRVSASRGVTGPQRLHFPNGLMLEWDGSADLALVEHLLRLSQASS